MRFISWDDFNDKLEDEIVNFCSLYEIHEGILRYYGVGELGISVLFMRFWVTAITPNAIRSTSRFLFSL